MDHPPLAVLRVPILERHGLTSNVADARGTTHPQPPALVSRKIIPQATCDKIKEQIVAKQPKF